MNVAEKIGSYHLVRELGKGGMGTVYLAEHELLNTISAIKILNPEYVFNEHVRKRFISEAKNLAKMNHPNLVKVNDLITEGERVAIVMEYVEGETLKAFLEKFQQVSDEQIKNVFHQMLEAVEYVHQQQLVHRDIKPSNFIIDRKLHLKLLDFGIAKNLMAASGEHTITQEGSRMGTQIYMSPEQIKSTKDVSYQSDIYSLGVVLWQMISGVKPYDATNLSSFEIDYQIVHNPLPLTKSKWDDVIQRATAKKLEDRYQSIHEFYLAFKKTAGTVRSNKKTSEETIIYQKSSSSAKEKEQKTKIAVERTKLTPEKIEANKQKYIEKFTLLDDIASKDVKYLKAVCADLGLVSTGNKLEVVDRIAEFLGKKKQAKRKERRKPTEKRAAMLTPSPEPEPDTFDPLPEPTQNSVDSSENEGCITLAIIIIIGVVIWYFSK